MKEMRYGGNIFLIPLDSENTACVVTTNGQRKSNGRAVMGTGIAKYARDHLKGSDLILGELLHMGGNRAYLLGRFQDPNRTAKNLDPWVSVITMPTKHHWKDPSDLDLIQKSARELIQLADEHHIEKIYLPAPGCANGRLDYITQVRPAIARILDQRFVVCLAPDLYDRLHPKL